MTETSFLTGFLVVLMAATLAAFVFDRFKLPTVLGFLLAGTLVGPRGLQLISDTESIHQIAELGIVLLMFTIGLEFSVRKLKGLRSLALIGGTLQMAASFAICIFLASRFGWRLYEGYLLGVVLALSSTAIVLKHLLERGELETPHGRICLSILVFQDLVTPVLLVITAHAGGVSSTWTEALSRIGWAFIKGVLVFGAVALFGKYLLSRVLRQIAESKNREVFLLASVAVCLGISWISDRAGLSLALGAFAAGVIFANSDYGPEIAGEFSPFRHVFVSVFFVAIGLLFDWTFAYQNFHLLLVIVTAALVINTVIVTLVVLGMGYSLRISLYSGILLSQVGEFSFLLIETARRSGGVSFYFYQMLLTAAFATMFISPFLFAMLPWMLSVLERIPSLRLRLLQQKRKDLSLGDQVLKDHVIVCGFGPVGRELAATLYAEKVPFLILDVNPKLVERARSKKYPVLYGDAVNREVLKRAGILEARAFVITFVDPVGMIHIIKTVQHLNPGVFTVVRTRYEKDIGRCYEAGADWVVLEEWEMSVQMNRIMLKHIKIPKQRVDEHLEKIRMRQDLVTEEMILMKSQKQESGE